MHELSIILHSVSRDVLLAKDVPLHTFEHYMNKLNHWAADLPDVYDFKVPLSYLSQQEGRRITSSDKLARVCSWNKSKDTSD